MTLAVSASGARFVSGKNEWWEHQGEATYSVNDELVFTGRLQRQPDHLETSEKCQRGSQFKAKAGEKSGVYM